MSERGEVRMWRRYRKTERRFKGARPRVMVVR